MAAQSQVCWKEGSTQYNTTHNEVVVASSVAVAEAAAKAKAVASLGRGQTYSAVFNITSFCVARETP